MLVSWLIPLFTANPEWLEQCLNSCLTGGVPDSQEIIICCDGVVDNTDVNKILTKWRFNYNVEVIRNKYNRGVEYALNDCIRIAKGEYLARIDTDDYSELDRVPKQIKFLEDNKLDACGSWMRVIGGTNGIMKPPPKELRMQAFNHRCPPCYHPSILFKASSIKALGDEPYPLGYRRCEDLAFFIRAINRGWKLDNIPEVLVNYRIHTGSTATQHADQQYESAKKALREWASKLK